MHCAVSLSTENPSEATIRSLCDSVRKQMGKRSADLAVVFVTQHYADFFEQISKEIQNVLKPQCLLGATAAGIIGEDREIENRCGISLWAASMPGVSLTPFHLQFDQEKEEIEGWPELPVQKNPAFLLIAEPFSIPADRAVEIVNQKFPGAATIGGLASGGVMPGQNRLFYNDEILDQGAIGVVLGGNVEMSTVVSQGCRPVGKPLVITQAEKNVIYSLGGKPALEKFQSLFQTLPPVDQQLLARGLHVGRAVNEMKSDFQRGDFIVRNVMGADQSSGAMAIGDFVRKGQTVQFHVRDADSAREDLRVLLGEEKKLSSPAGALIFSCNGRGVHLFGEAHHDVQALHEVLGPLPAAGCFAAGEIGPIGGKNFLHGFTASIALFRERSAQ